ncbi:MAG: OmpP1/FadL family transporter [Deltaproteobacteria bacterium]
MRFSVVAALAVTLASQTAFAAGDEYPDNGAEGLGRAGAMAAKADDGTAIYYNPSGLAEQDGLRILVDGMFANDAVSFQRTDPLAGTPIGPQVSNGSGTFVAPFVAVSYQVLSGLTFALGVYGPPANGRYSFPGETPPVCNSTTSPNLCGVEAPPQPPGPGNDPQKYSLINENLFVAYPTLSVGWRPFRWLELGLSGQLVDATTQFSQAAFDGAQLEGGKHQVQNESPQWDTIATLQSQDQPTQVFAGVVGVTVLPVDRLRIGASYRPPINVAESGSLNLQYSTLSQFAGVQTSQNGKATGNAQTGGGPATLAFTLPGELKSGVSYAYAKNSDVELDFDWEQWSQFQAITVTPQFDVATGGSQAEPLAPLVTPKSFLNTWSLRLGSDYRVPLRSPVRLTLRAGLGYESSVYDLSSGTSYTALDFANFAQTVASLGVTVGYKWVDLVVGYAHVFEPMAQVRNSGVTMTQNQAPQGTPPVVVGDGNYQSSYDILSAGLRLKFL